MSTTGIDKKDFVQICVVVEDIERTAANYREILGYDIPDDYQFTQPYDHTLTTYYGKPSDAGAKMTSFMMGGVSFELLQPLDDASVWMDFLKQHGEGIHHVTFNVPRTAAATAAFADHGYEVTHQGFVNAPPSRVHFVDSEIHPIQFFSSGESYRFWGLFESDLHLFDAGEGKIFLLGTDHLARDMFTRILAASRVSLTIGLARAVRAKLLEMREHDPGRNGLEFLGLGMRPPAVSWGTLLEGAQNISNVALRPWMLTPALFVIVTVLLFNFIGDGLRDAADPPDACPFAGRCTEFIAGRCDARMPSSTMIEPGHTVNCVLYE